MKTPRNLRSKCSHMLKCLLALFVCASLVLDTGSPILNVIATEWVARAEAAEAVVESTDAVTPVSSNELGTLKYEDERVSTEVVLSADSTFKRSDESAAEGEISLAVEEGSSERFADLPKTDGFKLEALNVALYDKNHVELEQSSGTADVKLIIKAPDVGQSAEVTGVEVYFIAKGDDENVQLTKLSKGDDESAQVSELSKDENESISSSESSKNDVENAELVKPSERVIVSDDYGLVTVEHGGLGSYALLYTVAPLIEEGKTDEGLAVDANPSVADETLTGATDTAQGDGGETGVANGEPTVTGNEEQTRPENENNQIQVVSEGVEQPSEVVVQPTAENESDKTAEDGSAVPSQNAEEKQQASEGESKDDLSANTRSREGEDFPNEANIDANKPGESEGAGKVEHESLAEKLIEENELINKGAQETQEESGLDALRSKLCDPLSFTHEEAGQLSAAKVGDSSSSPFVIEYEDNTLAIEAQVSGNSEFVVSDIPLDNAEVRLTGNTEDNGLFSELANGYEGEEMRTFELSFCNENGEQAEQVAGSTQLTLTIPADEENTGIKDVEVYRYTEGTTEGQGHIERVEDIRVDGVDGAVTFDADGLGAYAVRYTVDFSFNDSTYNLQGFESILLSQLLLELGLDVDLDQVTEVRFSNPELVEVKKTSNDWMLTSLKPFTSEESLTLALASGREITIQVTDAQYTTNLRELFHSLDILKNGQLVDLERPIIVRDGDNFTLKMMFTEHDEFQFFNDDTVMYYKLPEQFVLPSNFSTTTDVVIEVGGKKHTLKNNAISYDHATHSLSLQWNTTDVEFQYLVASGNAQVIMIVDGQFDTTKDRIVKFSDTVSVEIASPADAGVEKRAVYDDAESKIHYTLRVAAEGDVYHDIFLEDTLEGQALSYLPETLEVSWGDTKVQSQDRIDAICAQVKASSTMTDSGRDFHLTIAADSGTKLNLKDGEVVIIQYDATVHTELLTVSASSAYDDDGNLIQKVFDDTGNTVVLTNPDNRYDEEGNNTDTTVTPVDFSNMIKTVELTGAQNGQDAQGNDIRYRDAIWTIETNTAGRASLAGSTISDTLTYYPDYIKMALQPLSGPDAGILIDVYDQEDPTDDSLPADTPIGERRFVPWSQLHVSYSEGTDVSGEALKHINWTYDVPETDLSYKYVITYTTRANLPDVKVGSTVFNEVQGKGGYAEANVTIWPTGDGDNIHVKKEVERSDLENIVWKIDIDASLSEYQDYFRVTDILPFMWIDRGDGTTGSDMLKDGIGGSQGSDWAAKSDEEKLQAIRSAIQITGLTENEKWEPELVQGNIYTADRLMIHFYKKDGNGDWIPGLNQYPEDGVYSVESGGKRYRRISITMTTDNNAEWVKRSTERISKKAWLSNHTNKVQVRGDVGHYDFDSAVTAIVEPTILKRNTYDPSWSNQYYTVKVNQAGNKQVDYPAYRFIVNVGGIRDDNNTVQTDAYGNTYIEVVDTYDMTVDDEDGSTSIWKLYRPSYTSKWNSLNAYFCDHAGYPDTDDKHTLLQREGFPTENVSGQFAQTGLFAFEEDQTNGKLTMRIYYPPKKDDGGYQTFYTFMYFLWPRNQKAMDAIVNETLKQENQVTLAHVTKGIKEFTNTAELIRNDDSPLVSSDNYVYEYNPTGKSVTYDPENKIAHYEVVLNAQKARLLGSEEDPDDLIEMKDVHSSNLIVDYETITVTTDPEENRDKVTYDYSGYTGTFQIPDRTAVRITYDARVNSVGNNVSFSNTVSMKGFQTGVDYNQKVSSQSNSTAGVYQLRLFKYASGDMGDGLSHSTFRLLDANRKPVTDRTGAVITFESGDDGYTVVTLNESEQGVSLKKNTVYYLQEIQAPDGYKQDPLCYSFVITENPYYTSPDGAYVFGNGDILKVRNYEDLGGINISKNFAGNVTPTEEQKANIVFRIEKLSQGSWQLYKEVSYEELTYSDEVEGDAGRITGTFHDKILSPGIYRVVERNAEIPGAELSREYMVDNAVYDQVTQFEVTEEDLQEETKRSHNVVITNTYFKPVYTITKCDTDSGATLAGATFATYEYNAPELAGLIKPDDTLVKDDYTTGNNGKLEIAFSDGVYQRNKLYYATELTAPGGYKLPVNPEKVFFYFSTDGWKPEVPAGYSAVNLSRDYGAVTLFNEKDTESLTVRKTFGPNGAAPWMTNVQYVKVGLYRQEEGVQNAPVDRVYDENDEPVTMILTSDDPVGVFENLPSASDNGKKLIYSVREVAVSFDGETDSDPKDTFTVTYSDETVNEGTSNEYTRKVINNVDKGTTLTVKKEWYEKRPDGSTALIPEEQRVGDEYNSTFSLYRTSETDDEITAQFGSIPLVKSSATAPFTLSSGSVSVEPGDTIRLTFLSPESGTFTFEYASTQKTPSGDSGWNSFLNSYASFPVQANVPITYDWVVPTEAWIRYSGDAERHPEKYPNYERCEDYAPIAKLYLCNWGNKSDYGTVSISKVQTGSTYAGQISQDILNAATNSAELVTSFELSESEGWIFESDTLERYNTQGEEYTYWVLETSQTSDTSYVYNRGDVTVKNYKDSTTFEVSKQWFDSGGNQITDSEQLANQPSVLFDLYRTTEELSGTNHQQTYPLMYRDKATRANDSPTAIDVEPGDTLRFYVTVGCVSDDIIYLKYKEGDKINGQPVTEEQIGTYRYPSYVQKRENDPTINWFSYSCYVFDCDKWSGQIVNSGQWWKLANSGETERTFTFDYTLKETDMPSEAKKKAAGRGDVAFYIREYDYPGTVKVEVIHNSQELEQPNMEEYVSAQGTEKVSDAKGIELNSGNGWKYSTKDKLALPISDSNGIPYHYFAVERVPDSLIQYDTKYEQKASETIIKNTEGSSTSPRGSLSVNKRILGNLPDGNSDKEFYFTLSKNGYYYNVDGRHVTDAGTYVYTLAKQREEYDAEGNLIPSSTPIGEYKPITFNNLPPGTYTITELMKKTGSFEGAEIPYYSLTSTVKVGGTECNDNKVSVVAGQTTAATIENQYTYGVEQTTITAQKHWYQSDGVTKITDSGALSGRKATLMLKRLRGDQADYEWNENDHVVTLDGEVDSEDVDTVRGHEDEAWHASWSGIEKVYWDYETEQYVDFVYEVVETGAEADGTTSDMTDNRWLVDIDHNSTSWTVKNTPNTQVVKLSKQWNLANGSIGAWPKDGTSDLPITVTMHKALSIPGQGMKEYDDTLSFTLVPDNDKLAVLNASTSCTVTYTHDGGLYTFDVAGLENTRTVQINNKEFSGTWVYSFNETTLDGFSAPNYGTTDGKVNTSAANGGIIINTQRSASATVSVTKLLTLGDGVTPDDTHWPTEGFAFALRKADGTEIDQVTATKSEKTQSFPSLYFTEPGTYEYTITETDGQAENITYDTSAHTVVVTVAEEKGKLMADVKYDASQESLRVVNKYTTPGEVLFKVRKTFVGGAFSDDVPFTFTLSQAADANATTGEVKQTITTAGKSGSVADLTFDPISLTAGTYYYLIEEEAPASIDQNDVADLIQYPSMRQVRVKVDVRNENGTLVIYKNDSATPYDMTSADVDTEFTNAQLQNVTAVKTWLQSDGTTPLTPDSGTTITLQLKRWKGASLESVGDPVTLDSSSNWTNVWPDLPVAYLDGSGSGTYEYLVEETEVNYGGSGAQIVSNGMTQDGAFMVLEDSLSVTNRQNLKDVEFGKQWLDGFGNPAEWPANQTITVTLKRDGDAGYSQTLVIAPPTPLNPNNTENLADSNASNVRWTWDKDDPDHMYWFRIEGLPWFKEDGKTEWHYYVEESSVPNTITRYSDADDRANERTSSFAPRQYIVNRPETIDLRVTKEWVGTNGGIQTTWPTGKSVRLSLRSKTEGADWQDTGVTVTAITSGGALSATINRPWLNGKALSAEVSGSYPFVLALKGLPYQNDAGAQYLYSFTEAEVSGYETTYLNAGSNAADNTAVFHGGKVRNSEIETTPTTCDLTITKTVAGNMADTDKDFSFTVQNTTSQPLTLKKEGEENRTVVSGANETFLLRHGQQAALEGVPVGEAITVSEDSAGYAASYRVGEEPETQSNSAQVILNGNTTLAFTNRLDVILPTGVSHNVVPFAATLLFLLGIAIWRVMCKQG